ncbi:MAG: cellulase family glycosylhydrolase [Atopobiaceae bacterium]|nr:cellulase family glycosylhydrolase [Atopobiaceae bacterium]
MEKKYHGVNLGNWLVLERWMKPSLWAGSDAEDVYGLERDVPKEVLEPRLAQHYDTYVTLQTFKKLAELGVDLVRLPVPYWTFGSAHHKPVVQYVDRAFGWAEQVGLKILIDLHTVPGSQNGFDNGGICGLVTWHKDPARIDFAVDVIRQFAERYAHSPALFGIEPLNEPVNAFLYRHSTVARYGKAHPSRISQSQVCPLRVLKDYYRRCYHVIRAACPNTVAVVLHDRFELRRWNRFMPRGSSYQNVWMDTHMYLGFSDGRFRKKDLAHYLRFANRVFAKRLSRAAKYHPVLVGEWSNANHIEGLASKPAEEQRTLYQQLSRAQLAAWDKANGGCFWSFANDAPGRENWSLLASAERGWLAYH